ncbi:hypothetical protein Hanom_Chr09g00839961 [Helianthus anomalus]
MGPEGVGTGELDKEDERMHGDYGGNEGMHGENSKLHGAANLAQSPRVLERTWDKSQSLFDLNKSIEGFSVGSSRVETEFRSKKRPRRCRSPCEGESGGPMGQEEGSAYNPLRELIKKSKVNEEVPSVSTFNGGQDKGNGAPKDAAALGGSGGISSVQFDVPSEEHIGNPQVPDPGEGVDADNNVDPVQQETAATVEIGKIG